MVSQTLIWSALFAFLTSGIYAFVGYSLSRRGLPASGKLAAGSFVVFWYGLAISSFLGGTGLQALLGAFGYLNLGLSLLIGQISLLAISVALWGLLYYLVYLYTGWHRAWIPLALFYVGFYAFLQYFLWDAGAEGVRAERWSVVVDYRRDIADAGVSDPYVLALVIGLLVPQIVASLAYLTLAFGVRSPTQRYRILLVSLSILTWFSTPFLALASGVSETDGYQLGSRLLGLFAAIVIFLAYYPPGFMRRRYGITSLTDDAKAIRSTEEPQSPPRTELRRIVTTV